MAKFLMQIEDQGDEVTVQCAIEPPLEENKELFTTAELLGLYMREHMADLLKAAVAWSKEPEPQSQQGQLKLVMPDDITGAPV